MYRYGGYKTPRETFIWFIILLSVSAIFMLFMAIWFVLSLVQVESTWTYQQGQCIIIGKQMLKEYHQGTGNGSTYYEYWPNFSFTVLANNGHTYQASGYDVLGSDSSSNAGDVQSILAKYAIGRQYPCWYNPADPSHAELIHNNWSLDMAFSLVGFVLLFALASFLLTYVVRNRRMLSARV